MARTLHHVDLTVSDLRSAKRSYEPVMEYLGYRMTEDSAQDLGFASGDEHGTGIMLHPARPQSRDRKHDRYAPGLHHLAFRATSRDEVDGLHRLLERIGATILDPPAVYYPPNYYAVFFADPDGVKLEFVHNLGGH
jgi:catechol 2,3-dioxygenase-like lactoylglutathione lyase family enzyme